MLTSAGLSNKKIVNALVELTGKDPKKWRVAFVPTAANVSTHGDMRWLIKDLVNFDKLGVAAIDIVDISALSEEQWLPRLKKANILCFEGGNTLYLMHWIRKSGLDKILPELLKTRVYMGISAGSIVVCPSLLASTSEQLYDDEEEKVGEKILGLSFVDFHIRPHFGDPDLKKFTEKNLRKLAENMKEKIYAIDDNSAIKVNGKKIEVVGTGKFLSFN